MSRLKRKKTSMMVVGTGKEIQKIENKQAPIEQKFLVQGTQKPKQSINRKSIQVMGLSPTGADETLRQTQENFEIASKRHSIPIEKKIPLSDVSVNRIGSDFIKSLLNEGKEDVEFRSLHDYNEKHFATRPIKVKLESIKRNS